MKGTAIITQGYPRFTSWVTSNGTTDKDWYLRSRAVEDKLYIRSPIVEGVVD